MVKLTDLAATILAQTLEETPRKKGQILRLIQNEDGCGLEMDIPRKGDQVIKHNDEAVLLVNPELNEFLGDVTVDIVERQGGVQVVLQEE